MNNKYKYNWISAPIHFSHVILFKILIKEQIQSKQKPICVGFNPTAKCPSYKGQEWTKGKLAVNLCYFVCLFNQIVIIYKCLLIFLASGMCCPACWLCKCLRRTCFSRRLRLLYLHVCACVCVRV